MDRTEAIRQFECHLEYTERHKAFLKSVGASTTAENTQAELDRLAIAALREQEQREQGCEWCKPGLAVCGTCKAFFDYHNDGGSDKCSANCNEEHCAYYEPMPFCPMCGRKMGGADHEKM